MSDNQLQPRESLNKANKAFLKVKPDRESMEKFRANLLMLLDHCLIPRLYSFLLIKFALLFEVTLEDLSLSIFLKSQLQPLTNQNTKLLKPLFKNVLMLKEKMFKKLRKCSIS
jgi:hypothetical protein